MISTRRFWGHSRRGTHPGLWRGQWPARPYHQLFISYPRLAGRVSHKALLGVRSTRTACSPGQNTAATWRVLPAGTAKERDACRRMLRSLLFIAHEQACEAELAHLLEQDLDGRPGAGAQALYCFCFGCQRPQHCREMWACPPIPLWNKLRCPLWAASAR